MTTCPNCNSQSLERGAGMGDVIETQTCHTCGYYERRIVTGWTPRSCEYGRRPITRLEIGFLKDKCGLETDWIEQ
jgi:predicted Zn-ribbon and HTH transcriptional regulator